MPAEFVIRVAAPRDRSRVADILAASYPVLMRSSYAESVLAAAVPLMTRANPNLLSAGTYYIAEIDGGPSVGCGGWTPERPGTKDVAPDLGHIRHFATHADWTGRGVGRSIYAKCEAEARAAGVRRFECYASLNAEGFYAALGFEPLRRIEIPLRQGLNLPAVLMARSI